MTLAIAGDLLINRLPIAKGRLINAVHTLTLNVSTSEVSEVVIELIDRRLHLWGSNQLARGTEVTWVVAGFKRELIIAVAELDALGDVELVRLHCRPAAIERLRTARGAQTWGAVSPTQWLANECQFLANAGHTTIKFVGQPTTTRSQIVRRAAKGETPESSWDVAGNLAAEEGFWLFENAGTVYFASPSYLATELAGSERDQWTWPRPANGKTPFMSIPRCRASDYATRSYTQPATVDASVPMEYALTLAPADTIRVEIPGFRGRYLVTSVSIAAGQPLAQVTLESPVDPAPNTDLATLSNPTLGQGSDTASSGLSDNAIAAYWYNAMIGQGYSREQALATAPRMVAVALVESRGVPTVHNPVPPDDSWGFWQINVYGGIHGEVRSGWEAQTHTAIPWPQGLTIPEVNAYGAVLLSAGGKIFQPWHGDEGKYPAFLGRSTAATAAVAALPLNRDGTVAVPVTLTTVAKGGPDVERFVQFALAHVGDDYQLGSTGAIDENGKPAYDCSGLVYAALTAMGHTGVPHSAAALFAWCRNNHLDCSVNQAKTTKGALLFRLDSGATNHVVISLGDGVHDVEAKGEAWGVVVDTEGNRFDHGGLIPGLVYA